MTNGPRLDGPIARANFHDSPARRTYGPRQLRRLQAQAVQVRYWAQRVDEELAVRPAAAEPVDPELIEKLTRAISDVTQRIADVRPSKVVQQP